VIGAVMAALLSVAGIALPGRQAAAETVDVAANLERDAIMSVIRTSYYAIKGSNALGPFVPFTRVPPAGPGGLNLLFDIPAYLEDVAHRTFTSADELRGALEDSDHTDPGKPTLIVGCKAGQSSPTCKVDLTDDGYLVVPLEITRVGTAPFELNTTEGVVNGGTLRYTVQLRWTLRLKTVAPNVLATSNSLDAVWLDTPVAPIVEITVERQPVTGRSRMGVARAQIDGAADAHMLEKVGLRDPSGDGRLTRREWETTDFSELVAPERQGTSNTANADVTVDPVMENLPTLPISVHNADPANVPEPDPPAEVDALQRLNAIGGEQLKAIAADIASALQIVSAPVGFDIPFVSQKLSDLLDYTTPVLEAIERRGVSCKTDDSASLPADGRSVDEGTRVTCVAQTIKPVVGTPEWFLGDTSLGGGPGSAGPNPAPFSFSMPARGVPDIHVKFKHGSEDPEIDARQLVTVEDLADALHEVAGDGGVRLLSRYDPQRHSIVLTMNDSRDLGEQFVDLNLDRLRASNGLVAVAAPTLQQPIDQRVRLQAGTVAVNLPFLIDLGSNIPAGAPEQRLAVDATTEPVLSLSGLGVTVPDRFGLQASIGFLSVTAKVPQFHLGHDAEHGDNDPNIALRLRSHGADRIRFTDFMDALHEGSDVFDPDVNLAFSGRVEFDSSLLGPDGPRPGLNITWPHVGPHSTPDIQPDADFLARLGSFNYDTDHPAALLGALLAGVQQITGQLGSIPGIDTTIPLIGVSPHDLLNEMLQVGGPPTGNQVARTVADAVQDAAGQPGGTGAAAPPASLQDLEGRLEHTLGLGTDGVSFAILPRTAARPEEMLEVVVKLGCPTTNVTCHDKPIPLSLGIPATAGLIGFDTTGTVTAKVGAAAEIHVGIPLKVGATPVVLDSTTVSIGGQLVSPDLGATVNVGPFALSLGKTCATPTQCPVLDLAASVSASPQHGVWHLSPISGHLRLHANLSAGNQVLTELAVDDHGSNLSRLDFSPTPDELIQRVSQGGISWALVFNLAPQLLGIATSAMHGAAKVPLVGDPIAAAGDVVGELERKLTALHDQVAAAIAGAPNAGDLETKIEDFVTDLGAPITGVTATAYCPGTSTGSTAQCAADRALTDVVDLRVNVALGATAADITRDINLGLAGLPLSLTGSLHGDFGWKAAITFGLDRVKGPYVMTNGQEFAVTAKAGLAGPLNSGCNATAVVPGTCARIVAAKFGFLGATMWDDDHDASGVDLTVAADLQAPQGSDGRLAGAQLANLTVAPSVSGRARLNAGFRAGIDSAPQLPSIVGRLDGCWGFGTQPGCATHLNVDNVYVDTGSLVGALLKPVAEKVRTVAGPMADVAAALTAPVPGLSTVTEALGLGPVTLLDLVGAASGGDGTDLIRNIAQILALPARVDSTVSALVPPGAPAGLLPLGSHNSPGAFGVDLTRANGSPTTGDHARDLVQPTNAADAATPFTDGASHDRGSALGVTGLSFPVFDHPTELFNYLMGQDISLVRYDPGELDLTARVGTSVGPIPFGPFPISLSLNGSITAKGRLIVGYDTLGIRKAIAGGGLDALAAGLYLEDAPEDAPELSLIGTVTAGAALDLVLIRAGVEGGLQLTVNFDLPDPNGDGKTRFAEVAAAAARNPLCMFRPTGDISVIIQLFGEIGFGPLSVHKDFTLANEKLVDFAADCPLDHGRAVPHVDPSGLLTLDLSGDPSGRVVKVEQTGAHAIRYKIGEEDPVDIQDDALKSVRVIGTRFDDAISLVPGVELAQDSPASTITIPVTIEGADGNDTITTLAPVALPSNGSLKLCGGPGNDSITSGPGNDAISGGSGSDTISTGAGRDSVFGDVPGTTCPLPDNGPAGNDHLDGGPDTDYLFGDGGDDTIDGGIGVDPAIASAEQNLVADGPDYLVGGLGSDRIEGGEGDDIIVGDSGPNIGAVDIVPDPWGEVNAPDVFGLSMRNCDTTAVAGDGNDTILGGAGGDLILGQGGDDVIEAGDGDDYACGGHGSDAIIGDRIAALVDQPLTDEQRGIAQAGADVLYGGPDGDIVYGGDGIDVVDGGDGSDSLYGGEGSDLVYGDTTITELSVIATLRQEARHRADLRNALRQYCADHGGGAGCEGSTSENWNGPDLASASQETPALQSQLTGFFTGFGDVAGPDDTLWECPPDDTHGGAGGDDDPTHGGGGGGRPVILPGDTRCTIPPSRPFAGVLTLTFPTAVDTDPGGRSQPTGVLLTSPCQATTPNADCIFGGDGVGFLYGVSGGDLIVGGAHVDLISGGGLNDVINGSAGDDLIVGDSGHDTLLGGAGSDAIKGGLGRDVLIGNSGNDSLEGDDPPDGVIHKYLVTGELDQQNLDKVVPGPDILDGGDGNDPLIAGVVGDDDLRGGKGDDVLKGGPGNDKLDGGTGADDMSGGDGYDTVSYSTRTNAVTVDIDDAADDGGPEDGRSQPPTIFGGLRHPIKLVSDIVKLLTLPRLFGQSFGNDAEMAGLPSLQAADVGGPALAVTRPADNVRTDVEVVVGGQGDDTITGSPNSDTLFGGPGDDHINGGGGNDDLHGQDGYDYYDGGDGTADRCVDYGRVIASSSKPAFTPPFRPPSAKAPIPKEIGKTQPIGGEQVKCESIGTEPPPR
jgi:Ca2+-binding RTX toxin-like protein